MHFITKVKVTQSRVLLVGLAHHVLPAEENALLLASSAPYSAHFLSPHGPLLGVSLTGSASSVLPDIRSLCCASSYHVLPDPPIYHRLDDMFSSELWVPNCLLTCLDVS